jgi:hypothetical protein
MRRDEFLAKLDHVERAGAGYTAKCPAHDDGSRNSLSVCESGTGAILIHCFAGCSVEAIVAAKGLAMRDLFDMPNDGPRGPTRMAKDPPTDDGGGLTLKAYAAAKALPIASVKGWGVVETSSVPPYTPCLKVPYHDVDGNVAAVRWRLALTGPGRFKWRKGDSPCLYGLDRLAEIRRRGSVVLVEGESDVHTCWHHHVPALGVPGAKSWQEEWAEHLDGLETIYVVIEPDTGGTAMRTWLATSRIRDRVRLLSCTPYKDPSEMHLKHPDAFDTVWQLAVDTARPFAAIAAEDAAAREAAAAQACGPLARASQILPLAAAAVGALGVVRERRAVKLLTLAVVSRLLEKPVSVVLKGPSAAGKSFIVEQVLLLFPPSAAYALTAMSEHLLAYDDEPLAHRMFVLYEAAGLRSDFASYLVRSLLSEGRLRYKTVEKTKQGLRPRLIEREGPTGLIVTTTLVRLHPENETRVLSVPVTDTQEQTAAVLKGLAADGRPPVDVATWHALHDWLALGERRVVVPFTKALVGLIPPLAVRLRRDIPQLLALVKAHALLHRATRLRDDAGRIVATLADYGAVRPLVEPLIASGVGATVAVTVRETVEAVATLGPGEVTVRQVADALELDKSAALRRVQRAINEGYLINREDRRGRPARLELGDSLPEDTPVLPHLRDLRRALREEGEEEASPDERLHPCNPTEKPNADGHQGVVAGDAGCKSSPANPSDDGGVVATVANATAPPPATENPNTDAGGRDGCTVAHGCGGITPSPSPPWAGSTVEDMRRLVFPAAWAAGFPCLQLRPGLAVVGDEDAWRKFTATAPTEDLEAAHRALARGAYGAEPPSAPAAPAADRASAAAADDRTAAAAGAARAHARRVAATGGPPKQKQRYAPIFTCAEAEHDAGDDAGKQEPTTGSRTASSSTSTSRKRSKNKSPTRAERPLWKRLPPPELDDDEAQIWANAARHIDPQGDDEDESVANPHERQAWLAHLERLDEVAAHRRARSGP